MKLEQQVTSLELSKKLKSLGVPQKSLFYWAPDFEERRKEVWGIRYNDLGNPDIVPKAKPEYVAAFTVAELFRELHKVGEKSIIVALDSENIADVLAETLCTKLQNLKENAGTGHMQ